MRLHCACHAKTEVTLPCTNEGYSLVHCSSCPREYWQYQKCPVKHVRATKYRIKQHVRDVQPCTDSLPICDIYASNKDNLFDVERNASDDNGKMCDDDVPSLAKRQGRSDSNDEEDSFIDFIGHNNDEDDTFVESVMNMEEESHVVLDHDFHPSHSYHAFQLFSNTKSNVYYWQDYELRRQTR